MKRKALLTTVLSVCLASTCLFSGCSAKDVSVKVSFDVNCETTAVAPESITCLVGKEYNELPTLELEQEGYHFAGWNTRADGTGRTITEEDTVYPTAGNHTLYAVWAGNEYNVSFDLNGGNINGITEVASRKVTYGELYGNIAIPASPFKEKQIFKGWYLNPEGTGEQVTVNSLVRTIGDHTVYAVYQDIVYNYDFSSPSHLEAFSSHGPKLDCAIVNGENGNYLEVSNNLDTPIGKLFLKADLKAGTTIDVDVEFIGEVDYDDGVRAGIFFYGANIDGSSINSGSLGEPGAPGTPDEVTKWYWGQGARNDPWEEYIWQNGHIRYTVQILEDCYGLQMMMEFGKKELLDENGEVMHDANGAPVYVSDKSLWQNNTFRINSINILPGAEAVTVDFDLDGGEVNGEASMEARELTTGQTYGALPVAQKEGYDFRGWCLSADGSGEYITSESLVKVAESHTVYAIFRATDRVYNFTSAEQADDFYALYGDATYEIVNGEENYLKISSTDQDAKASLVFNIYMQAGWSVEFDVEFVGGTQGYVGFFTYGAKENGKPITEGALGLPGAPGTAQEITDWYWGKGVNNSNTAWNNGKFTVTTNILEDCYGVHLWLNYGADSANSYWKITAVRINRA